MIEKLGNNEEVFHQLRIATSHMEAIRTMILRGSEASPGWQVPKKIVDRATEYRDLSCKLDSEISTL